jgi:serine/threonine protein kinase
MAVVYRARHQVLGSVHAIKVLSGSHRSVRERLLREGRVQAALKHPNVVGVTDVVMHDASPALVMEYVSGPTLADLLAEGPIGLGQALALMRGIVAGVAAAHRMNVIHRDLKPSNVLLERVDGKIVPRVADFGLVKALDGGGDTRTGSTMGTPAYMAPEQIRDAARAETGSDVFSLGAILYELTTGRRALPGVGVFEIYQLSTSEGWLDPAGWAPDLPEPVLVAIRRSLKADLRKRLSSCAELLELLDSVPRTEADDVAAGLPPLDVAFDRALVRRAEQAAKNVLRPLIPGDGDTATVTTDGGRTGGSLGSLSSGARTPAPTPVPAPTSGTASGVQRSLAPASVASGMRGFVYGMILVAVGATVVLLWLRPWEGVEATAMVQLEGVAKGVSFVSDAGSFGPGALAEGAYRIMVETPAGPVHAGDLVVEGGDGWVVRCDQAGDCVVRAKERR